MSLFPGGRGRPKRRRVAPHASEADAISVRLELKMPRQLLKVWLILG